MPVRQLRRAATDAGVLRPRRDDLMEIGDDSFSQWHPVVGWNFIVNRRLSGKYVARVELLTGIRFGKRAELRGRLHNQ